MQKARAIHDREMVEKTNEIKRVCVTNYREWSNCHLLNCLERDNIIKQHEARIRQLENVLARRIYDEVGESRLAFSLTRMCKITVLVGICKWHRRTR